MIVSERNFGQRNGLMSSGTADGWLSKLSRFQRSHPVLERGMEFIREFSDCRCSHCLLWYPSWLAQMTRVEMESRYRIGRKRNHSIKRLHMPRQIYFRLFFILSSSAPDLLFLFVANNRAYFVAEFPIFNSIFIIASHLSSLHHRCSSPTIRKIAG